LIKVNVTAIPRVAAAAIRARLFMCFA